MAAAAVAFEKNNFLTIGAFGDLLHDFGEVVKKKQAEGNDFKTDFTDGLPTGAIIDFENDDVDEEDILKSIFNPRDFVFVPSVGDIGGDKTDGTYYTNIQQRLNETVGRLAGAAVPQSYVKVTTKSGIDYTLTQAVIVKNKKSHLLKKDEKQFHAPNAILNALGVNTNSAFVVDATAVGFTDFLLTEDESPVDKNYYFITNPETENDAAGKASPMEDYYYNNTKTDFKNGIKLFSLQQTDTVNKFSVYTWNDNDTTTAYGQFFSKYTFQLSDLIEVVGGKTFKNKTDLIITNPDDPTLADKILDSGTASNITNVKASIFSKIKNLFGKKNNKDKFITNSRFQHKRSGDWLQVLSCLDLKNRAFKYPNHKKAEAEFKNVNFEPSAISDVYLVTHDRIALAFALYLGVNAIYTHAATAAIYVFKNDASSMPPKKIALEQIKKFKALPLLNEQDKSSLIGKVASHNMKIDFFNASLATEINTLLETLKTFTSTANTDSAIRNLFIKLNSYCLFLNKYKKIENYDKLNTLFGAIIRPDVDTITASISTLDDAADKAVVDPLIAPIVNYINNYTKYQTELATIKTLVSENPIPAVITADPAYEKMIKDKWKLLTNNFTARSDDEKMIQSDIAKKKYDSKNINPFVVTKLDLMNVLPAETRTKVSNCFNTIKQMPLFKSFPDKDTNANFKQDKITYVVMNQFISEIFLNFGVPNIALMEEGEIPMEEEEIPMEEELPIPSDKNVLAEHLVEIGIIISDESLAGGTGTPRSSSQEFDRDNRPSLHRHRHSSIIFNSPLAKRRRKTVRPSAMVSYLVNTNLDNILEEEKYELLSQTRFYSLLNTILTADYAKKQSQPLHPLFPLFMLAEALLQYVIMLTNYNDDIYVENDREKQYEAERRLKVATQQQQRNDKRKQTTPLLPSLLPSYQRSAQYKSRTKSQAQQNTYSEYYSELYDSYESYYIFLKNLCDNINTLQLSPDPEQMLTIAVNIRAFFFTQTEKVLTKIQEETDINIRTYLLSFYLMSSKLKNYISGYIIGDVLEPDLDDHFYESYFKQSVGLESRVAAIMGTIPEEEEEEEEEEQDGGGQDLKKIILIRNIKELMKKIYNEIEKYEVPSAAEASGVAFGEASEVAREDTYMPPAKPPPLADTGRRIRRTPSAITRSAQAADAAEKRARYSSTTHAGGTRRKRTLKKYKNYYKKKTRLNKNKKSNKSNTRRNKNKVKKYTKRKYNHYCKKLKLISNAI